MQTAFTTSRMEVARVTTTGKGGKKKKKSQIIVDVRVFPPFTP